MKLSPIYAIVLRQCYLLKGSVARLVPLFAWVAIDIILWGFITRYLSHITTPGFNLVTVFLSAVLMWDFLSRVMQGVTMAFFEDVWSRNFLNLFASPLSVPQYISGLVISSILTSAVGLVIMLVLAGAVFGLSFAVYGMMLLPFIAILFLFGIALGVLGCALVLRMGPAAEWFIWPIPALISPFACVFYPLATLPHWMQCVSYLLPPAHVFEAMRSMLQGNAMSAGMLAFPTLLAVLYVVGACLMFSRVHRFALHSGLIARYSAESVS